MNEIFVARKAFADTFTSSAVCRSVSRKGTPSSSKRRVQFAHRGLGVYRVRLHSEHDPIG